jgi:hypothetical protein
MDSFESGDWWVYVKEKVLVIGCDYSGFEKNGGSDMLRGSTWFVSLIFFSPLFLYNSSSIYSSMRQCEWISNLSNLVCETTLNFLLFKLCSAPKGYHSLALRRKKCYAFNSLKKKLACKLYIFRIFWQHPLTSTVIVWKLELEWRKKRNMLLHSFIFFYLFINNKKERVEKGRRRRHHVMLLLFFLIFFYIITIINNNH